MWGIKQPKSNSIWTLKQLTSTSVSTNIPITSMKSACFGRFACVAADISVWELESTTPMWHKEGTITAKPETTAHIAWSSLADGTYLLSVGCGSIVATYAYLPPAGLQDFHCKWVELESAKLFSIPCSGLSWTRGGTLIAASGQRLFISSKWTPDEVKTLLFRRVYALHCSLPLYHPKVLIQYLNAGELEKVQLILKHLLQFMKECQDGSQAFHISLSELLNCAKSGLNIFLPAQTTSTATEDDQLSSTSTTQLRWMTQENLSQLQQAMNTVTLPWISRVEQMQLLSVIDTLSQLLG